MSEFDAAVEGSSRRHWWGTSNQRVRLLDQQARRGRRYGGVTKHRVRQLRRGRERHGPDVRIARRRRPDLSDRGRISGHVRSAEGQCQCRCRTSGGHARQHQAGGERGRRYAASEISTSTTDLSQRTEEQAASLAETTSSMEALSATVKKNAENAQQADQLAVGTREVAEPQRCRRRERGGCDVADRGVLPQDRRHHRCHR